MHLSHPGAPHPHARAARHYMKHARTDVLLFEMQPELAVGVAVVVGAACGGCREPDEAGRRGIFRRSGWRGRNFQSARALSRAYERLN